MDIKLFTDDELIKKTKSLIQIERETLTEILHHLREIESRKLYAKLGYPSLFDFTVKHLGYSEAAAQRRISSMRLLKEIPEIEEKITRGTLSLSNIARAQIVFRSEARNNSPLSIEKKKEVLQSLENKSSRQAEVELLKISPAALPKERERQVTPELTEIKIIADEKLMAKIRKAKDLMSHKNPNMTNNELLEVLCDLLLKKLDPAKQNSLPTSAVKPKKTTFNRSRYIPSGIKRKVWSEAQSKCQFEDLITKRRCDSTRFLEIHHVNPFSIGGETKIDNLKLYCRTHNSFQAIEDLGWKKMAPFLKLTSPISLDIGVPRSSTLK